MASFAESLREILIRGAVESPKNGRIELKDRHQRALLFDAPSDLVAVDIREIGKIAQLAGFRDGGWKKSCDYLLAFQVDGNDCALLVELKKTLRRDDLYDHMEQLRWSRPLIEYLRAVCKVLAEVSLGGAQVSLCYILISEQPYKEDESWYREEIREDPHRMMRMAHKNISINIAVNEEISWERILSILAAAQSAGAADS
ncbi:MAG: hypothetical protein OXT69_06405 [Candidatus Poribacteria bacterium]|nr:hypothetical protein [Candidatus Poribacteria bacterium]